MMKRNTVTSFTCFTFKKLFLEEGTLNRGSTQNNFSIRLELELKLSSTEIHFLKRTTYPSPYRKTVFLIKNSMAYREGPVEADDGPKYIYHKNSFEGDWRQFY